MATLVGALERHVSVAAANNRRAPFALGDADELGSLVNCAGFRNVTVRSVVDSARFPSPEKLVDYQLTATPLATLRGMTDHARAAVIRDVRAALQAYVDDDGLTFPMEAHLVVAYT